MRSFQHHHPPGPPICTTSFCPPWRLIEDAKRPAINGKNGIDLEAKKRRKMRENERERSRVCFQTNIKESRKTGKRRRLLCGPTQISHWRRRLGFGWFDRPPARRQEKPPKYPYIPLYEDSIGEIIVLLLQKWWIKTCDWLVEWECPASKYRMLCKGDLGFVQTRIKNRQLYLEYLGYWPAGSNRNENIQSIIGWERVSERERERIKKEEES